MPTNYYKCNNCNKEPEKIFHKMEEKIFCKNCSTEMVKIYVKINSIITNDDSKNESISSSLQNNKKELEKLKNKEY